MTITEKLLKGKVLKILDPYSVIVNIGYNDGIQKDMKFIIYTLGEEIYDPETNDVIDKLEIIKHRMRVVQIQEKFSILKSDEYNFQRNFLIHAFGNEPFKTLKELNLNEKVKFNDENKKIIVGDLVRQDVT